MSQTWAVVTGASAGLGAGYADRLAAEGLGVVLVARSADKLDAVAARLRDRYGVPTRVLPADLTDRDARAEVADLLRGETVSHLVNNAGAGQLGDFASLDEAVIAREVELDVVAPTELARAALPGMIARGRGAVVNVSSTAAFQPIPGWAVYASAKAYVLNFSISLWEELKPTGVRVVAVCPGPTDTEFFINSGDDSIMRQRRSVEQVVDSTFAALHAHRPFVVDGPANKVLAFSNRFAPRPMQGWIARRIVSA